MTSSGSSTHYPSWFQQDDGSRQNLNAFTRSLGPRISPISDIYTSLEEVYQPFRQTDTILPFQCRRAIKVLKSLCTYLEACICFLKDTSSLPLVLLALRYRLLDELYYIEEQSYKLMSLIEKYNRLNETSSMLALSQQGQAIDILFTTLLSDVSSIHQKTSFLMEEAQFQEKGLSHQ